MSFNSTSVIKHKEHLENKSESVQYAIITSFSPKKEPPSLKVVENFTYRLSEVWAKFAVSV